MERQKAAIWRLFTIRKKGHYLWRLAEAAAPGYTSQFLEGLKSHQIYADSKGLFDFVSSGYIWVKVRTLQADSLEAAERRAIQEIDHSLPSIERGYAPGATTPSPWPWDSIHARFPISSEFNCGAPPRADCPNPRTGVILSISRQEGNWRLVLRNYWDQEVILDSELNPLGTHRLVGPE